MWRLIGITPEKGVRDEQKKIIDLLDSRIDLFHIRKPSLTEEQLKYYLDEFPIEIRNKLTIHYHQSLALEFGLGGVHFNLSSPYIKPIYGGKRKSFSCHNINEMLETRDRFDYVFLSPIYNSISKDGYKSKFNLKDLRELGLINEKTIALGGITEDKFAELKDIGFGGAALLGSLWKEL
ncbi:MAG: thiamine phosphate synthase [Bacteroidales bacterium]|nr:thiamine phosphate synthase [Bacteroidales bacterium]